MGLRTILIVFFIFAQCELLVVNAATSLKSARLCFLVKNSTLPGKEIFINGKKIGEVPLKNNSENFQNVVIEIPQNAISAITTVNIVNIESSSVKDMFSVKNIFLEIEDSDNTLIKSDIAEGPFNSFQTGVIRLSNDNELYTYNGTLRIKIRLLLPNDKIGYRKQPIFEHRTDRLYRDSSRKKWGGLTEQSAPARTICYYRMTDFNVISNEYIQDMLERYNSNMLQIHYEDFSLDHDILKSKAEYLHKHGIKIRLMFHGGRYKSYQHLPESIEYKKFFTTLYDLAQIVDAVGMDEWWFSREPLLSEDKFLIAFEKWSGYSSDDALWAFNNYTSDDTRALKAWDFSYKIKNDFAKEFVRTAKKANPQIKTWISYVTRNWNRNITSIDSAINSFDEIFECQTLWYGRVAQDSLNSPLITAPMGIGKILKTEYSDKFLWTVVDPIYVGGQYNAAPTSWSLSRYYNNTIEEIVPYLALLYAISNGVVIQNFEGRQLYRTQNLFRNSPYNNKSKTQKENQRITQEILQAGVDGSFIDQFADAVALVSKVVPHIDSYRKSDIAYYYDPDADWEIVRKGNHRIASRQTNEIALGLIQEFCDVDVTKNVRGYKNVIYAGQLLPSEFDYANQNIYLMYAPEYDENGNKLTEKDLLSKLNIKGFDESFGNVDDDATENKNIFKFSDIEDSITGKNIKGANFPIRIARSRNNPEKSYVVTAGSEAGNIRVNSLWPSFMRQNTARTIIKQDLDYFGWTKRDCPQVNGIDKMVAVAFREPRTAVIDFGRDVSFANVKIIMFNGREGVIRNEILQYKRGMKIEIPPLNVLVAEGSK